MSDITKEEILKLKKEFEVLVKDLPFKITPNIIFESYETQLVWQGFILGRQSSPEKSDKCCCGETDRSWIICPEHGKQPDNDRCVNHEGDCI